MDKAFKKWTYQVSTSFVLHHFHIWATLIINLDQLTESIIPNNVMTRSKKTPINLKLQPFQLLLCNNFLPECKLCYVIYQEKDKCNMINIIYKVHHSLLSRNKNLQFLMKKFITHKLFFVFSLYTVRKADRLHTHVWCAHLTVWKMLLAAFTVVDFKNSRHTNRLTSTFCFCHSSRRTGAESTADRIAR